MVGMDAAGTIPLSFVASRVLAEVRFPDAVPVNAPANVEAVNVSVDGL